jgi:hypothetical protein
MPSKEKIILERGGVSLTPYEIFKEVQSTIKVGKTKFNSFSKFYFRSVEDIYVAWNSLGIPLVLKLSDEIIEKAGRLFVEATAEVKDLTGVVIEFSKAQAELGAGKAGMSTEQATGSASSYARKYALNGLFLLDDAKDPDAEDSSKPSKPTAELKLDETKRKEKIKVLQDLIRGDKAKTEKATKLLAGRSVLKLTLEEIDVIINDVKSK